MRNKQAFITIIMCTAAITLSGCAGASAPGPASEAASSSAVSTIAHNDWIKDKPEREYDMPSRVNERAEKKAESDAGKETEEQDLSEKVAGIIEDLEEDDAFGNAKDTKEGEEKTSEAFQWDDAAEYASFSKIHSDDVTVYYAENGNGHTVAINAGHGCEGGESEQTQCHPDGSPKVTGGSTDAGAMTATAINSGTTLSDGTKEAEAVLKIAFALKDALLDKGYNVLMLRENDNTQLDNIARTVYANRLADCHISLHYDSTDNDKGVFYVGVPENGSYREMEPVKSHWQEHEKLGEALVKGLEDAGMKLYDGGRLALDLTQTSYSTIPSVDLEVGDKASDRSDETMKKITEGVLKGLDAFFG